jgi:hypothetical protein
MNLDLFYLYLNKMITFAFVLTILKINGGNTNYRQITLP